MKKFIVLPLIGAAMLVLVLLKVFSGQGKEKTTPVQALQRPVQVECIVAELTLADISYAAVGKTRANERVELASEISGRLVSIHFREGIPVKKGELLFRLDDALWIAELARLTAKLDLARETESRNRAVFETGGISRQVFDEMVSQRKILEAEEQMLRVQIEKANIRAPFDGVAGIRNVSAGAFISPGTPLTVIEDLSRLKVEFSIPEVFAAAIRKGDRIFLRADGIPDRQEAVIEAFDPSVDVLTGNLRVLAVADRPHPALKAGVAVRIDILASSPAPAVFIPTQALVPIAGGYTVFAVEQGKASSRRVTTGIRTENSVEIVSGVNPGDSILATGFMRVRQGSPVHIVKIW